MREWGRYMLLSYSPTIELIKATQQVAWGAEQTGKQAARETQERLQEEIF